MTQEEKQLLLKDLSARIPYGVMCEFIDIEDEITATAQLGHSLRDFIGGKVLIKPYLRPMSSMTEEETNEYNEQIDKDTIDIGKVFETPNACMVGLNALDWLNAHHFDYRGLIEKGLALEAPEGMYEIVPTSI